MQRLSQPGQLARLVDRLRFLEEHQIGTGKSRLGEQLKRQTAHAQDHLLLLNHRAFHALPETALPEPSPTFSPVARLFDEGKSKEALLLAKETVEIHPHARSWANTGDLQILHGDVAGAEASFRRAQELLGKIPPIEIRMGRILAARGDWKGSLRKAISALSENPLYGSARYLFWESQRTLGYQALYLPMRERIQYNRNGERHYLEPLSPSARLAWRAWAEVDESMGLSENPPRKSAYYALVDKWRSTRGQNPTEGYIEPAIDGDVQLNLLSDWADQELLTAYLWVSGLGHANANAFRDWLPSNKGRLQRFWEIAVLPSHDDP